MTEETIVRELERRANHVHGAPLSLDDVRGKAHAIRRRRRATAAAAVVAVVATVVIVPTLLSGGHDDRSIDPAPAVPGHTAVLHDGVVTLPDGGDVAIGVDNEDVSQFGVLTDGRIVVATFKPYGVSVYAADGDLQQRYSVGSNAITMSADDTAVAWVGDDLRIDVLASGAPGPTELPGIPMAGEAVGSIDAVLDAEHLLVGDYSTTTGELTPQGHQDLTTSQPLRVTDVSPDGSLWAVQFPDRSDPQFGCSGLYDPQAQELVTEYCETSGLQFSPDGQHLLGTRGDNNMAGEVEVLDLDLHPVGTYDPSPQVVSRAGWDDADHLLVSVAGIDDNQWSLERVDIDGFDAEVVAGPAAGRNPEFVAEYLLSE